MRFRSRTITLNLNLSFFSCLAFGGVYNFLVPPSDDFGDWATPKEPTVGHFFSLVSPRTAVRGLYCYTGFATDPLENPLSAGARYRISNSGVSTRSPFW